MCRGGTSFVATASANIPEVALRALWNTVTGAAPGAGISLQPNLALVLTQSESWELTLEGGPSFGAQTGALQNVGINFGLRARNYGPITLGGEYTPRTAGAPEQTDIRLTIPLESTPQQIRRNDCSRLPPARPRDVFECRQIIPEQWAAPGSSPVMQAHSTIYVLFAYKTDQIVGWRFEGDETIYLPRNPHIRQRVNELIQVQGFLPSSVVGHTSPEGLRRLPRPRRGYSGNDPLSRARAIAAFRAFFDDICTSRQTYGGQTIVPRGESEFYSPQPQNGHEVEGRELEIYAVPNYVAGDSLRPSDPATFLRQPYAQQVAQTYSLLRRAEIRLERNSTRTPAVPPTEGQPEHLGPVVTCPPAVEAAARPDFRLDLLPGD